MDCEHQPLAPREVQEELAVIHRDPHMQDGAEARAHAAQRGRVGLRRAAVNHHREVCSRESPVLFERAPDLPRLVECLTADPKEEEDDTARCEELDGPVHICGALGVVDRRLGQQVVRVHTIQVDHEVGEVEQRRKEHQSAHVDDEAHVRGDLDPHAVKDDERCTHRVERAGRGVVRQLAICKALGSCNRGLGHVCIEAQLCNQKGQVVPKPLAHEGTLDDCDGPIFFHTLGRDLCF